MGDDRRRTKTRPSATAKPKRAAKTARKASIGVNLVPPDYIIAARTQLAQERHRCGTTNAAGSPVVLLPRRDRDSRDRDSRDRDRPILWKRHLGRRRRRVAVLREL